MTETVVVPKVGELTESVVFVAWLCEEGDRVEAGQSLAEVETDKVTTELTSPVAGVLTRRLVEVGDEVPVGAPYCEVER
jgi:Pyruvate/2-oxoglutarate dehydrogenase complex, dihydrolipoamide acyltransferase (E2) component, and related enzymes